MTRYLELDDALYVVERMGFIIRDAGLLASALARPATAVAGVDAYPALEKAAALLESVARNRALIDGNKRAAWTLAVIFLWINGFQHDMDADIGFDLVIGVAEEGIDLDMAAAILRAHLVAR